MQMVLLFTLLVQSCAQTELSPTLPVQFTQSEVQVASCPRQLFDTHSNQDFAGPQPA